MDNPHQQLVEFFITFWVRVVIQNVLIINDKTFNTYLQINVEALLKKQIHFHIFYAIVTFPHSPTPFEIAGFHLGLDLATLGKYF